MIRDRLVYPGNPAADAYLRAGRNLLAAQVEEESSRSEWLQAVDRDDKRNGFYGSAEARQRAEGRYDAHRHQLVAARRLEGSTKKAATEFVEQADGPASRNSRLAALALVEGELIAVWADYYDLINNRP